MRVKTAILCAFVWVLAACGADATVGSTIATITETTATPETVVSPPPTPVATTTVSTAPSTTPTTERLTSGHEPIVATDVLPEECQRVLIAFLQDLEPLVDGVPVGDIFESPDFPVDEFTAVGEIHDPQIVAHCPEQEDGEGFRHFITLAERHAPGAVPYLEAIAEIGAAAMDTIGDN